MVCVSHPGYSWAITEATVHANVEWSEGKEEFPNPLSKNFPSPPVSVGRSRSNQPAVGNVAAHRNGIRGRALPLHAVTVRNAQQYRGPGQRSQPGRVLLVYMEWAGPDRLLVSRQIEEHPFNGDWGLRVRVFLFCWASIGGGRPGSAILRRQAAINVASPFRPRKYPGSFGILRQASAIRREHSARKHGAKQHRP